MLNRGKDDLKHGAFMAMIRTEIPSFGQSTANMLMKIAVIQFWQSVNTFTLCQQHCSTNWPSCRLTFCRRTKGRHDPADHPKLLLMVPRPKKDKAKDKADKDRKITHDGRVCRRSPLMARSSKMGTTAHHQRFRKPRSRIHDWTITTNIPSPKRNSHGQNIQHHLSLERCSACRISAGTSAVPAELIDNSFGPGRGNADTVKITFSKKP